jgi:hypothetical protein
MYTIEWTPQQIVWQIDGKTVRTLEPANAENQYPQTPMQVKIGAWSGGDSANPAGTISWARGPTDYSQGPFSMKVMSLKVQDYSTGTQYVYGDQTGTHGSIQAVGGTVFAGGNAPVADAPAVTATATGQPLPFTPHQTSDYVRPSVYPWIPDPSATPTAQPTFANYPGLPSGWTVSDSGKVVPPSSATVSKPHLRAPNSITSRQLLTIFACRCPKSLPIPRRRKLRLRIRPAVRLVSLQATTTAGSQPCVQYILALWPRLRQRTTLRARRCSLHLLKRARAR